LRNNIIDFYHNKIEGVAYVTPFNLIPIFSALLLGKAYFPKNLKVRNELLTFYRKVLRI